MLGNMTRNIFLLRHKSILFKRIPQAILNTKIEQSTMPPKVQHTAAETNDDAELNKPIQYSKTKAYNMRVDEYRISHDRMPWYQPMCISLSLAIFLIYFCILREENDIDMILKENLGDRLYNVSQTVNSEKNIKALK